MYIMITLEDVSTLNFEAYLNVGGFTILDDFWMGSWGVATLQLLEAVVMLSVQTVGG